MSQPGMGMMIRMLWGRGKDAMNLADLKGQVIKSLVIVPEEDSQLDITFADGGVLTLRDNARSCCESRYMSTDDNLDDFIDAELRDINLENGPDSEGEYGSCHEVQFLRISTSKGMLVLSSHNEHNGWYGGIAIDATYKPAEKTI